MNHPISLPSYENDPNSRREFDYLQVPNVRHDSTPTHSSQRQSCTFISCIPSSWSRRMLLRTENEDYRFTILIISFECIIFGYLLKFTLNCYNELHFDLKYI